MSATADIIGGHTLLLHGHPGHELRVFNWMERNRPTVFLMTDGSGGGAVRTAHSLDTARSAGAHPGSVFGLAPDRDWYAAILDGDPALFEHMIAAIVDTARAEGSTLLVSDAVDGYNPMHDLCEAVAAAAVLELGRQGHAISHRVVRAVAGGETSDIALELRLDQEAQRRKQAAIDAHAPLAEEVRRLLAEEPTALAVEQLRRPTFTWPADHAPGWESVGASRVAASKYSQRIEYARHVRPLALSLRDRHSASYPLVSGERLDCAS